MPFLIKCCPWLSTACEITNGKGHLKLSQFRKFIFLDHLDVLQLSSDMPLWNRHSNRNTKNFKSAVVLNPVNMLVFTLAKFGLNRSVAIAAGYQDNRQGFWLTNNCKYVLSCTWSVSLVSLFLILGGGWGGGGGRGVVASWYKWAHVNLILGVILRWTNVPGESRSTRSCFTLQKPG